MARKLGQKEDIETVDAEKLSPSAAPEETPETKKLRYDALKQLLDLEGVKTFMHAGGTIDDLTDDDILALTDEEVDILMNFEPEGIEDYDELYFDDSFDMNALPMFDVDTFRNIFMSLRKFMDEIYSKKDKSDDNDETAYLLFSEIFRNCSDDCIAQDFMGYCFKKGKYHYFSMNYEKYMDFTILAAANGNAFSLQRLQLFMTPSIEQLLESEGHEDILDELNISDQNYFLFLSKILCEIMVKNMNISAQSILARPNVTVEQTDALSRKYASEREKAVKTAAEEIKSSSEKLRNLYEDLVNIGTPQTATEGPVETQEPITEKIQKTTEKSSDNISAVSAENSKESEKLTTSTEDKTWKASVPETQEVFSDTKKEKVKSSVKTTKTAVSSKSDRTIKTTEKKASAKKSGKAASKPKG